MFSEKETYHPFVQWLAVHRIIVCAEPPSTSGKMPTIPGYVTASFGKMTNIMKLHLNVQ